MNLLVYGEPKVGKTVFCSTAMGLGPTLLLTCERGTASIRDTDVDVWELESMEELNEAYNWLADTKHEYKTVCLDSLTELQRLIAEDVLAGSDTPSMREWGIIRERIIRVVRYFRDLDCHTIFTALPALTKDEKIVAPDLVGKLKREIAAFFDEVGYMFVSHTRQADVILKEEETSNDLEGGELRRLILFAAHPDFIAGDRGGRLDRVESPNFTKIVKKTFGTGVKRKPKAKPKTKRRKTK